MLLLSKLDDYLEKFVKIIISSIIFLPFLIVGDFYFPFITPRNFLFRILVSIALAIYLYLFFRNKEKYRLPANKVLLSYVAFVLVMTVSSLFGGDFIYSFWSNAERMEGLLGLYYLVAFLIVILGIYERQKSWLELLRFSAWTAILMAGVAMSQHWQINLLIDSAGGERVSGTLGNPTYLAGYAMFNMFFLLYLLFKDKQRPLKLELWAFYILDILLIFFELKSSSSGTLSMILRHFNLLFIFLVIQLFVNLQYYFYKTSPKISRASLFGYYVLAIFLNFFALFYTQTRGVLVGLFVAAVIVAVFLLLSKYTIRKVKYLVATGLLLVVLLSSGIFIFKDSNFIKSNATLQRVANISISDTTTETRLLTWQLSLKAFADKPILGWGEEKFLVVFNKYFPTEIFKNIGSRVWFDRPHNVFLQQLVHGGILGLLAYLAIFAFAFKNLWTHYRRTHDIKTISIFGGLMIAYLVQNFFVFDSLNTYIPMIITLAVSIFVSQSSRTKNTESKKSNWWSPILAGLLILIIGYMVTIPQARANYLFIKNYKANIALGFDDKTNNKTLEIINSHYLGKFEFRQVYADYAQNILQNTNVPLEIKNKVLLATETELIKTISEQPDNVRNYSFIISIYMNAASLDLRYAQDAIALIENKAIPLSPTRTSLYYSLGRLYMNIDNFDKANENFLKAKELSPKVFESYMNLFLNYMSVEDQERAEMALQSMNDNIPNIDPESYARLANIYHFFSKDDKAIEILIIALDKYPQDLTILSQLAYYSNELKQVDQTQFYIDQIMQINPAFGEGAKKSLGI